MKKYILPIFVTSVFLSSCKIADIRTDEIKDNRQTKAQNEYARDLINQTIKKQGLDKLDSYSTYEITAKDHWKGMLGKIGSAWKWNKVEMVFRNSIGDFDGQVEVMEGKKKGFTAGLQSWNYYEKVGEEYSKDVKYDKNISFGMSAYHYFFEIADRLKDVPFIRYGGTETLGGQEMEKVYASWGSESTLDYDQYIMWIGKESGLIEALTYTIREANLPGGTILYGSTQFDDYTNVGGILIPFKQTIQLNEPNANKNRYIHQLTISKFEWDSFPVEEIRPFVDLEILGDEKVN